MIYYFYVGHKNKIIENVTVFHSYEVMNDGQVNPKQ